MGQHLIKGLLPMYTNVIVSKHVFRFSRRLTRFTSGGIGHHLQNKNVSWEDPKTAWTNATLCLFLFYIVIVLKDCSFIDDLPSNKCDSCFPMPFWITQWEFKHKKQGDVVTTPSPVGVQHQGDKGLERPVPIAQIARQVRDVYPGAWAIGMSCYAHG